MDRRIIRAGLRAPQQQPTSRPPGISRMPTRKPRPPVSQPPTPPARGVKASTWQLLLDTGMRLIQQDGHIPSVAEVAVRSNVSRATAYRYFPSRSALVTAVIDSSLGPVRSFRS